MNVGSRRNLPLVVFPHVRLLYLGTSRSRAVEPTSAPSAAQGPATDSFHRLRVRAADPYPPVGLLQSCPMLSARFSTFASTKRPFVTSGSRP